MFARTKVSSVNLPVLKMFPSGSRSGKLLKKSLYRDLDGFLQLYLALLLSAALKP